MQIRDTHRIERRLVSTYNPPPWSHVATADTDELGKILYRREKRIGAESELHYEYRLIHIVEIIDVIEEN
jgi:hypothetical protein